MNFHTNAAIESTVLVVDKLMKCKRLSAFSVLEHAWEQGLVGAFGHLQLRPKIATRLSKLPAKVSHLA